MIKRRILITGGGGFIGYHLAKKLLTDPSNEIVIAENFQRGRQDSDFEAISAHENVRLIVGDLRDAKTRDLLGKGYDEVYHLAAMLGVENVLKRPVDVLKVNALMTADVLDWFVNGGGEKLLFSSTSEAYAWTQSFHELPIPTPETVPLALTDLSNPRSTYAGSKIFGELCVTQFCSSASLPFVIARYHNVYGPRMGYDHVIPQLFTRISAGENPLAVYSADHIRAFCYVDDAVDATIASMRNPSAAGLTFNIGNDEEPVTIGDLAKRILRQTAVSARIEPKEAANDPIPKRCPDVTKARRLLAYTPQCTLDQGLKRTLDWYGKQLKR